MFSHLIAFTGAHPVVQRTWLVCDICETGFQPIEGLESNTYSFSQCHPHSPACQPDYGLSQCQAGTAEVNIGCACTVSLGFSPRSVSENCICFTEDDPCEGCEFKGCQNGTIKNDRGMLMSEFA